MEAAVMGGEGTLVYRECDCGCGAPAEKPFGRVNGGKVRVFLQRGLT